MSAKMKRFGMFLAALTVVLTAVPLAPLAGANPPERVSFQGMARDTGGNALDGPVAMVFRLYQEPAGGGILWEETYDPVVHPPAVSVSEGLFTVALGDPSHRSAGSYDYFPGVFGMNSAVYLAVQVGEDPEMAPRILLASAPFALNALTVGSKGVEDLADISHQHAASDIISGTLDVVHGGTGLTSPDASGNILTSSGSAWISAPPPSAASTGAIVDAADATLTRSGAGTAVSPYKLALNLGKANAWTGAQTFQTDTFFPAGNLSIGKAVPAYPIDMERDWAVARLTTKASNLGAILELKNVTSIADGFLGTINFNNAANDYPGMIAYRADNGMSFSTSGIERLRIDSYGRVGIGIWEPLNKLDVAGNAGFDNPAGETTLQMKAKEAIWTDGDLFSWGYGGNANYFRRSIGIGVTTPGFPLTFAPETGDKISLYTSTPTEIYGFGVGSSLLQVFSSKSSTDIAFGYGSSANFTERMRIKGNGNVGIGTSAPTYKLQISADSAAKPNGGSWTNPSDSRLKKNIRPFEDGLSVLRKIDPVRYQYNGLAGLPKDMECIGVVAQEIKDVAPYTVGTFQAKLDERAESETELYDFNSSSLTFVLINAVKELDIEVQALSGKASSTGKVASKSAETALLASSAARRLDHARTDSDAPNAILPAPPIPERFPVCEPVEPGDVLVNDTAGTGAFCLGRVAADAGVVGIASSGSASPEGHHSAAISYPLVPVATSGIVYCKADSTYGPISPNDLLVTSPTPGHAMRAQSPAQGTIVGKALEPLQGGTGLIRILVMLR
jgi:hypothetical protein